MSDMKCPSCQQELKQDYYDCEMFECHNPKCKHYYDSCIGREELWQELIRTRKELEQSEICCTEWEKQALDYKAENIALSGDLERTRKALDVAVDALKLFDSGQYTPQPDSYGLKTDASRLARKTLEQITALEQKDVK